LPPDERYRPLRMAILLVMLMTLLPRWSGAQTSEQVALARISFDQTYGSDYNLLNGRQYYQIYSSDSDPYLNAGLSRPGKVVIQGVTYEGILINYDLYQQVVILQYIGYGGEIRYLTMNRELVDEFELDGQLFRKAVFEGTGESYAQVIPSETRRFLITFRKELNFSPSSLATPYHYGKQKKRIFLEASGTKYPVGSRSSFLKTFDENERPAVMQYLKREKIRFHRATDSKLLGLLQYCDQLEGGKE